MGVLDASTSPPKERYAVSNDNVIHLIQPGIFDDQLTEVLRNGARALLAKAVERASNKGGELGSMAPIGVPQPEH